MKQLWDGPEFWPECPACGGAGVFHQLHLPPGESGCRECKDKGRLNPWVDLTDREFAAWVMTSGRRVGKRE